MKKEYQKPEVKHISFTIEETIADGEMMPRGIIEGEMGTSDHLPEGWE